MVISNSRLNSYGFRVLTAGIDISQYQRNPILLWMHNRSYRDSRDTVLPIGRVSDLHVDGDNLVGTLVFDGVDEFSRSIKAKWDAGTLKMVSAGLEEVESSEAVEHLLQGQRYATITKSKLIEVSVVDIGANDDAIALYNNGARITLSLDGNSFLNPIKPNLNNFEMKQIAMKLGLPESATEAEILAKIGTMQLQADKAMGLEQEAEKQRNAALEALVSNALSSKRITAEQKEHFMNLGKVAGYDSLSRTLELMQPAMKPTDMIRGGGAAPTGGYKKLSEVPAEEAIRLRADDRAEYIRLYEAEYGVKPMID